MTHTEQQPILIVGVFLVALLAAEQAVLLVDELLVALLLGARLVHGVIGKREREHSQQTVVVPAVAGAQLTGFRLCER